IQNDGFKVENANLKRRYQELSTSNSHSRDMLTRKLTALIAENAKLKSESLSKMHSEPIVPEKPKVLAPGIDDAASCVSGCVIEDRDIFVLTDFLGSMTQDEVRWM
nr:hypothetical protein [Tanacetum cinerariifolium]